MAKATLTTNETGANSLTDINANFTEIYTGQEVFQATGKTTPVDADQIGLIDSAALNVLKKLTWANLKATLKTYLTSEAFSFVTGVKDFASGILTATRPKITTSIDDTNGNEVIKTPATASAVNEITVTPAATGGTPDLSPTGDDTNISLSMLGKGTGKIEVELPYGSAAITSTSTTSATPVDVTGASFSFTIKKTSHVKVWFSGNIQNNTETTYIGLRFVRDAANLGDKYIHTVSTGVARSTVQMVVDASLAAGTYTYKLQLFNSNGTNTVLCSGGILFAEAIIA